MKAPHPPLFVAPVAGPWGVDTIGNYWYVIHKDTLQAKRIGRAHMKGTNAMDRAMDEASRRNLALQPPPLLPYSVLLLYPDYLTDNFGQVTYYQHVTAASPAEAVRIAQQMVYDEHALDDECESPKDFYPLLVTEGHHDALDPESTT